MHSDHNHEHDFDVMDDITEVDTHRTMVLLSEMISMDGQELADIVAFVHDGEAQSQITTDDIPAKFAEMLP
jgi:hypothetical protein